MKRGISILLSLIMVLSLMGCGGNSGKEQNTQSSENNEHNSGSNSTVSINYSALSFSNCVYQVPDYYGNPENQESDSSVVYYADLESKTRFPYLVFDSIDYGTNYSEDEFYAVVDDIFEAIVSGIDNETIEQISKDVQQGELPCVVYSFSFVAQNIPLITHCALVGEIGTQNVCVILLTYSKDETQKYDYYSDYLTMLESVSYSNLSELPGTSPEENSTNESSTVMLDAWAFDTTYVSNDYYDIVETVSYKDSIGYTVLVHKILAKKNASLESTIIAYSDDGDVIGKEEDDIILTAGQYNYFRYSFEGDITNATLTTQVKAGNDSFMSGERNAVEMVKYNQSGDNLYITFEQAADDLGAFAKFKLLLYKEDKIVETEDGYFSVYAEGLTEKGATDVASIWVYGTNFDRIEYIFEP